MALTVRQIELIRGTWTRVRPVSDMAAVLFYGRLFRLAPRSRALFEDDLTSQSRKLMDTLVFVVAHLDHGDELMAAARDLAIRHLDYKVTPEQYAPVGEALIWTLEQMLGSAFGEEEKAAWTTAYEDLAAAMIEAAYGKKAP